MREHRKPVHRHPCMMKSRTQLFIAIGLFILGIALYTFLSGLTREQPAAEAFPATVRRDCAPWDGSAFTVQIPIRSDGTMISVSIWQTPDIQVPRTFSFPDDTGQVGNASLIGPAGLPGQLSGSVSFSGVDSSTVVEGRFDLRDENATQYNGTFKAQWDDQIMLCG